MSLGRIEDIQKSVQNLIRETDTQNSFLNGLSGNGRYRSFSKRYPEACLSTSEAITRASACLRVANISKWCNRYYREQEFKNL